MKPSGIAHKQEQAKQLTLYDQLFGAKKNEAAPAVTLRSEALGSEQKNLEKLLQPEFPVGFSSSIDNHGRHVIKGYAKDDYWFQASELTPGEAYYNVSVGQKGIDLSNIPTMGEFYNRDLPIEKLKTIPDVVKQMRQDIQKIEQDYKWRMDELEQLLSKEYGYGAAPSVGQKRGRDAEPAKSLAEKMSDLTKKNTAILRKSSNNNQHKNKGRGL
jgi:hypothetical protein